MITAFDLVAIGECLIEMSEVSAGAFRSGFAGDVLNVLFYASRLEQRTALISAIGTDLFTKDLIELLEHESIDLTTIPVVPDHPNGLYTIRTGIDGEPHFSFWRGNSAARSMFEHVAFADVLTTLQASTHLHFSAIALAIIYERDRLEDLLTRTYQDTVISFDTNVRTNLWRSMTELGEWIERLAAFVRILFVSETDDRAIYGERTPTAAINFYHKIGYPEVIYRRGAAGSIVSKDDQRITVPALTGITVIDATGAGDAYNAGYLFGIRSGMSLTDRALFATSVASCALQVHGGLNHQFSRAMAFEHFARIRNQVAAYER